MKICLPVAALNGLDSEIFPHFKGAPALLIVESDTRQFIGIDASTGACSALPTAIDAVIQAGGMGRGLFNGLRMRGVRIFESELVTVESALTLFAEGKLEEVSKVACCGGAHHAQAAAGSHQGCGCSSQQGDGGHACGCGGHQEHSQGGCCAAPH